MRLEDIDIFIGMERIRVGTTARIGAAVTAPTDIDCSRAEREEPGGQATSERDERKKFERAASSSSNQWTGVVDGARTAGRRQATSYRRPLSVHTIHSAAAAAAAWGAPAGVAIRTYVTSRRHGAIESCVARRRSEPGLTTRTAPTTLPPRPPGHALIRPYLLATVDRPTAADNRTCALCRHFRSRIAIHIRLKTLRRSEH